MSRRSERVAVPLSRPPGRDASAAAALLLVFGQGARVLADHFVATRGRDETAPAVLVIAAQPDRTEQRYGSFADAFVDLEAGHVAQNILLTAAAHELAAVPVGSLDAARCAQVLALASGQDVHYLIPVGRPA